MHVVYVCTCINCGVSPQAAHALCGAVYARVSTAGLWERGLRSTAWGHQTLMLSVWLRGNKPHHASSSSSFSFSLTLSIYSACGYRSQTDIMMSKSASQNCSLAFSNSHTENQNRDHICPLHVKLLSLNACLFHLFKISIIYRMYFVRQRCNKTLFI